MQLVEQNVETTCLHGVCVFPEAFACVFTGVCLCVYSGVCQCVGVDLFCKFSPSCWAQYRCGNRNRGLRL